jgi:predicted ATP-binding protein involved in virulence
MSTETTAITAAPPTAPSASTNNVVETASCEQKLPSTYIDTLTLKNYRCFDNLTIKFHPKLTVLVAPNGGGKTSILDAIAVGLSPFLRYISSSDQRFRKTDETSQTVEIKDTDFYVRQNQNSDFVKVEMAVATPQNKDTRWDVAKSKDKFTELPDTIGQSQLSAYAEFVLKSIDAKAGASPVFAYYNANRSNIDVPERLRAPRVKYSTPTSALYGALNAIENFREMLEWFDFEEANELRAKDQDGQNYSSPLLNRVRTALSSLLKNAYQRPRFNRNHKFIIDEQHTGTQFQIMQLSQGYQGMLALGMDIARRLELAKQHLAAEHKDPPSIVLIDEIDLHLHPTWQQQVLGDLIQAFPNTQFIVTTHSPQVLTTVKNENIRIIKQNSEGTWEALPPTTPEVKGVESSVALNDIMGVNATPETEETKLYAEYIAEIEDGAGTPDEINARKKQLKEQLLSIYKEDHPLMLYAERLERFQAFKLRHNQQQPSTSHA